MNRQAQCLMRLRQQLFNECCSSSALTGLSAIRSTQTQARRAISVASTSKLPPLCRKESRTAIVTRPRRRHLSIGSILSPAAMRAYALKVQAESSPDDPAKHAAYFAVLLESGSKENATQAVHHYEQQSGINSDDTNKRRLSLLYEQKLFDLYLAALAISNDSSNASTKLAQAAQRRDAVLSAALNSSSAIAEPNTALPLTPSPPRPALTDAQIASAVLSRENPTASVRVLGHDTSASPQSDQNPAAPLADRAASPTAAQSPGAIGSSTTSTSSSDLSASSSAITSPPTGSSPHADAARPSNEPIRVVVEEARGNLFLRAAAWTGRTLFVTFLTLTLLSFLIDQSGIMRGATGKGGPNEFLPPASGKTYKFSDVHGCEEAKAELEEVVEFLKDPKKFSALGGRLPRGVLLTGPPGTGKTLLARAVAGEAGVKFLFASGSEFDEMYVGVGARRVRELFTAAKANAPAIIFIDELDAVGGKRSPKNMQYQQQTLNELLVQLDGFTQTEGVILIGATNFPESLDKALVRPGRFDRHIVVPLPDVRGRLAILKHHMTDVKADPTVDVSLLARGTPGFSGAELQNLVNQAAVQAARSGKPSVGASDFDWAKDRIMMGSQRKSAVITPEDKRLTAFHEAGHALVALLTEGSTPLHSVTCLPRGASLGLTSFLPEMDVTNHTFIQLKANLDVAFGGRAAEEIVYGKLNVTTGASSDIKQATNIANSMVRHYGYSDVVGPVDTSNNDILSPSTRTMIDQEVRRMLEEAKQRAFDVLTTNRVKLERLANALIEFETLSKSEVLKVIEGQKINKVMP